MINIYNMLKKSIFALLSVLFLGTFFFLNVSIAHAQNVVVVIDPGHGGDNLGGQTEEYIEQELTLEVARYMKERLEQYEGVDVYLTHDTLMDKDISREDRIKIAVDYNADFVFSLHFNMSENHDLFGAEVWTSAFGECYARGQEFARIEMEGLHGELGFFDRGIKTRLGKDGDDYYGMILYGRKNNIPTVIIEHCHMDEARDNTFLKENDNPYKTFGYIDADSVAKYFHLKSDALSVDYTNYTYELVDVPADGIAMGPDKTEPDYCNISLDSYDDNNAIVRIEAADSDGRLQYYCYSTDGGNSYSILYPWSDDVNSKAAEDVGEISFNIPLTVDEAKRLSVRVYNQYELVTDSNIIDLPAGVVIVEPGYEEVSYDSEPEEIVIETSEDEVVDDYIYYILGGLIVIAFVITVFLIVYICVSNSRRRKRRKRRKRKYQESRR